MLGPPVTGDTSVTGGPPAPCSRPPPGTRRSGESRQPREPGHRREHAGQATFVPAAEDVPDPLLSAFFSDLAAVPDPESEPDAFPSAPAGLSPAAGLSTEDPFCDVDSLTEEPRLSVR